jgi:hypothetical protein
MRQMEQPVGGANSFFYAHHTSLSAPSFLLERARERRFKNPIMMYKHYKSAKYQRSVRSGLRSIIRQPQFKNA